MEKVSLLLALRSQRGVSAVVIALIMVMLLGFAGLAIDVSNLFVAHNELQNAADAGALAGARKLYNSDGTALNEDANQYAYDAATANESEGQTVEVNWTSGNAGDVQRGHWSFTTREFTGNDSLAAFDLWDYTTEELDLDPDFINAVRVVTRREATPVSSFFARLFGFEGFQVNKEAVAYIGFAGTLEPGGVDQPIAICEDSLLQNDMYRCNIGRMINSSGGPETGETGGWTDFNQDDPCTGGTNARDIRALVCGDGNEGTITLGGKVAAIGGMVQNTFHDLVRCWEDETLRTVPWNLTLTVVECDQNNIGVCPKVVGAVNLNIIWIVETQAEVTHIDANAPYEMAPPPGMEEIGYWSSNDEDGQNRWDSFVTHFNLQNVDGSPAPFAFKSIYFLPDCSPHELKGRSGGENFGVLAKIPLLVQ